MPADWISCLQDAWGRHNAAKWFLLIFGLGLSGSGFTVGVKGLKTHYISWALPGVFFGVTGLSILIFSVVEIFFKNSRTIRLRRRRRPSNWTSPARTSLCEYHNAGLYISTADDLPSEAHHFCQFGRCLHSTEDIAHSAEVSEEYLEISTSADPAVETCTYYDTELRSVESDSYV